MMGGGARVHNGNGAVTLQHPSQQPAQARGHDHRTTFYGAKHGSNQNQSLSVPRSSIGSHVMGASPGNGHHRDASVHLNKRSGFSYF